MNTWLILDVSNLAHRAWHTTGALTWEGNVTGVLYGVFREVLNLQELFAARRIVFCFDAGYDYRLSIYRRYKESRRKKRTEMTEEELTSRKELRRQIYRLRTKYLIEAGFKNVLWQDGFEAEDLIAVAAAAVPKQDSAVIVSSDNDLLQLLSPSVLIWNPVKKKSITEEEFMKNYGIEPSQWADVKAIAGCNSDNVSGLKGIGEKTAAKYLAGNLKSTSAAFETIVSGIDVWKRNIKLTRLPAQGTEPEELVKDVPSPRQWDEVMEKLGMRSLIGKVG